ncbi:MAG TPA: hypothetical protein VEZ17_16465 [Chitinophagaceae bacterium]|jgi:hypothetical protein|nr:hypothetical protein [Chitinophagaceae bacterium]
MAIRFTEFMTLGNQDISLYIIQDADQLSCQVFIFGEESMIKVMFKKEGETWKTAPQNIPVWVTRLAPVIGSTIESRLCVDLE